MSNLAIKAEGISKQYSIGTRERYLTLRETISKLFRGNGKRNKTMIMALKAVSFEVARGEILGVVGRNGAGKSTLLKILSRITSPTSGRAIIHGRVGSLLEVGTGFHPELTGRENVLLNGAILGVSRSDMRRKFDDIVAFAEVSEFIDTPVKHYSSGMYARLAFAVAAHLDPEILLVDEVLSVGDLAFQRKCLGRMGEIAHSGRTIMFVSHQLNQIRRLCHSVLWLDQGLIRAHGETGTVLAEYEASTCRSNTGDDTLKGTRGDTRFLDWQISDSTGGSPHQVRGDGPVLISISLKVSQEIRNGHHGISLYSNDEQLVWAWAVNGLHVQPGVVRFTHRLKSLPIRPGLYTCKVCIYEEGELLDQWVCRPPLNVATIPVTHPVDAWQGILNVASEFSIQ